MHHEGMITSVDINDREDVEAEGRLAQPSRGALPVCDGIGAACSLHVQLPVLRRRRQRARHPAGFLFATVVLTIFSVGYVQMAKKLRAAGGMFTYVSHGLGRPLGLMSGFSLAAATRSSARR
jgi:hypothetical protein